MPTQGYGESLDYDREVYEELNNAVSAFVSLHQTNILSTHLLKSPLGSPRVALDQFGAVHSLDDHIDQLIGD
jgi:hypothetical protein